MQPENEDNEVHIKDHFNDSVQKFPQITPVSDEESGGESKQSNNSDTIQQKGFLLELDSTDFQKMRRHPRFPKHFGDKSNQLKPKTKKRKGKIFPKLSEKQENQTESRMELAHNTDKQQSQTQHIQTVRDDSNEDDTEIDDDEIAAVPNIEVMFEKNAADHTQSPEQVLPPYPFQQFLLLMMLTL